MRKIFSKVETADIIACATLLLCLNVFVLSMSTYLNTAGGKGTPPKGHISASPVVVSQEEVFAKKLVPLSSDLGENVYCEFVSDDEDFYYMVRTEGEDPIKLPFAETVLCLADDIEGCQLVKVAYNYTTGDGEINHIEGYRIYTVDFDYLPPHGDYTINAVISPAGYTTDAAI